MAPVELSIELGDGKRDGPTPEQQAILDAKPDFDEAIAIVLNAWDDLSTCRPVYAVGMGAIAGLIPWTAMREWCRVEGFDAVATDTIVTALRYVDQHEFGKRAKGAKK